MSIRDEMQQLTETLRYHADRYYNQDAPEISDYEYDMLQRKLRKLEAEHPEYADPDSPTKRVIGVVLDGFESVTHPYPMESLQDVFSFEEVREFDQKIRSQFRQCQMAALRAFHPFLRYRKWPPLSFCRQQRVQQQEIRFLLKMRTYPHEKKSQVLHHSAD